MAEKIFQINIKKADASKKSIKLASAAKGAVINSNKKTNTKEVNKILFIFSNC
ncbi:hypothetical protein AB0759_06165 [Scytonema tolypothrichoides VB-61278_2]|uniref:Uncharacterized protein n=1 Tax=Scytonema tolypothrichoides VB-61278_2 TaxID=3232314 RepID=A0ABW8WGU5_9CYAN